MTRQKYWRDIIEVDSELLKHPPECSECSESSEMDSHGSDRTSDHTPIVPDETERNWQKKYPGYKCVLEHIVHNGGWEKEGWFVLNNYDTHTAVIVGFFEGSYYSSQQGIREHAPRWQGGTEELVRLATDKNDHRCPGRRMMPDDVDFEAWCELYEGIRSWSLLGCPDWSNEGRWGPYLRSWQRFAKTPFATNVTRIRAATVIKAAWRGWRWRLSVLFNPHTSIGRRKLSMAAGKVEY